MFYEAHGAGATETVTHPPHSLLLKGVDKEPLLVVPANMDVFHLQQPKSNVHNFTVNHFCAQPHQI